MRHLRLDEPLQSHLFAFHALGHQRPRPRPHLCLRDSAYQHHPLSAPSGRRSRARTRCRGGRRLVAPPAGSGAIVLLITDGLDRDAGAGLAHEMDRLHRSCRRLIWLNPLLRYEGFEPRSLGMKAMMPYVDEFRPVHNLESLETLIEMLSAPTIRRGIAAMPSRVNQERAA